MRNVHKLRQDLKPVLALVLGILSMVLVSGLAFAALSDNLITVIHGDNGFNSDYGTAYNSSYSAAVRNITTYKLFPGSLQFYGSGIVTYSNESQFDFDTKNNTVSFWSYPTSVAGTQSVVDKQGGGSGWMIRIEGGVYKFYFRNTTTYGIVNTSAIGVNAWEFVTAQLNGTHMLIYLNTTLVQSQVMTSAAVTNANNMSLGSRTDAGADYYSGYIDEVLIWNRSITAAEITSLYNGGLGLAYPFTGNISTGLMSDGYCYQETADVPTPCGGLGTGNYSSAGAWGTIGNLYDGNYSTYSNNLGFPANAHYYVNYSIPTGTDGLKFQHSEVTLPAVTTIVNTTIPQSCFVNRTILAITYTVNTTDLNPNNQRAYMTCLNNSGSNVPITDVAGTAFYEEAVYLHLLQNMTVNLFNASNASLALGTTITITFQNYTNSISYSTSNGVLSNVSGLVDGSDYLVIVNSSAYLNSTRTFTRDFTNNTLNIYLVPSTTSTPILFQVLSADNKRVQNALITIDQFVNGTYQTVFSRMTDIAGQTLFDSVPNVVNYRILVSSSGYITQQFTSDLVSSPYIITLDYFSRFSLDQSTSLSGIGVQYSPTNLTLPPGLVTFNLTTTLLTSNASVSSTRVYLYARNSTIINSSILNSNGTANITVNLLPYNNTYVTGIYSYIGSDGYMRQFTVVYFVSTTTYTGTIEEARSYMQSALQVQDRIFLWTFLIICFAVVMYAGGIRGIANAGVTAMVGYALGYVCALNPIVLGIMLVVVALTAIAVGS